jgi:broad specificity phosphatase PhoE
MNGAPSLRMLLIRHGETDWSRAGRFCGRSDQPLNQRGIQQAHALVQRLRGENVTLCYTSPALRARQTAEILAAQLDVTRVVRGELREQDFGAWEDCHPHEVAEQEPVLWKAWQSGQIAPHGGESLNAVAELAQCWLNGVTRADIHGTIAVVSRGGLLQAMLCALLGTPVRPLWPYRLAAGGVAKVWLYAARAVLVTLEEK